MNIYDMTPIDRIKHEIEQHQVNIAKLDATRLPYDGETAHELRIYIRGLNAALRYLGAYEERGDSSCS